MRRGQKEGGGREEGRRRGGGGGRRRVEERRKAEKYDPRLPFLLLIISRASTFSTVPLLTYGLQLLAQVVCVECGVGSSRSLNFRGTQIPSRPQVSG